MDKYSSAIIRTIKPESILSLDYGLLWRYSRCQTESRMATTTAFIISSNSRAPQHCDVCSIKQKHARNTFKSHQILQTARLQPPWLPLKSRECQALRLDRGHRHNFTKHKQTDSQKWDTRVTTLRYYCIITKESLAYLWTPLLETNQGSSCLKMRRLVWWKLIWSWGVNVKVFIAIGLNTRHNALIFFNRKPFVPYTHL